MQAHMRHSVAIFLIAMATIITQILISRILSVTFYYHSAFAGITLAMLGLTAGALIVYTRPDDFGVRRADHVLSDHASRFAFTLVAAVLLHVYVIGLIVTIPASFLGYGTVIAAILWIGLMLASFYLLLKAFIHSGVCIALLLTRFPAHTPRLYAFDLAGAALGCVVVIGGLRIFDPVAFFLVLVLALSLLAWRLLPFGVDRAISRRVKIGSVVLLVMAALQIGSSLHGTPVFRLMWAKKISYITAPLAERWNTYSRIAVTPYDKKEPFGWGFGAVPSAKIEQKFLTIDADAGTVITAFDGNLSKVAYLKDDIINLGYHVRDMGSVAVIGVGGGRDILSALVFGAKTITGLEINPAIYELLKGQFAEFSGKLAERPGISLVSAEARSYLISHKTVYDLIQISLIDTWATTAAGGLTLTENKLYTTEAWGEFLDRLDDKGMLTVSRWYEPKAYPGEFYRMLAIASDTIRARDPKANPRQHILAAWAPSGSNLYKVVTVAVSKSPLTARDVARFEEACRRLRFTPLITPAMSADETAKKIASGEADEAFFDALPIDVTASTDDKPFFFHMARPGISKKTTQAEGEVPGAGSAAVVTLFALCIATLVLGLHFIVRPMASIYRLHKIRLSDAAPYMAYFGAIGLGFMMIEIAQMQRLMIFLGHPVYGLSVVLFTLLLASSIGSFLQQQARTINQQLWRQVACLCAVLILTGLLTPLITERLKFHDTNIRIITSALLMTPMGVFMGAMFPIGVRMANQRYGDMLPWFWGINGAASVFASVAAVVLSLQMGISFTFWVGTGCYLLCLIVLWWLYGTGSRFGK